MSTILIIIAVIYPTPFLLREIYKCHLMRGMSKSDTVFYLITSLIPMVSHLSHLLNFIFDMDNEGRFDKEKSELNKTYKCDVCTISSRKYQLKGDNCKNRCPHCDNRVYSNNSVDDNKVYPFAPKLNTRDFIKLIKERNKFDKLRDDLKDVENTDKELEAYEKLQMKKLQELEVKANEIRADLAKSGVNQ